MQLRPSVTVMAGRGYDRPERQNEYFVPGEGISREVIQADICRYLGNDALVRPGAHNARHGYLIRAYRNLTTEMITDLKNDSTRWEAEVTRRAVSGYPRGTYVQGLNTSRGPNAPIASYATSSIHEMRQQGGPSPTPYSSSAPPPYSDYGTPVFETPTTGYNTTPTYTTTHPQPYGPGPGAYVAPPSTFTTTSIVQPPVTAGEMHYTYTTTGSNPQYNFDTGRSHPRYPGPPYDELDPPTTGPMGYPTTTSSDSQMRMDSRYYPETFVDSRAPPSRPPAAREREPQRRPRQ